MDEQRAGKVDPHWSVAKRVVTDSWKVKVATGRLMLLAHLPVYQPVNSSESHWMAICRTSLSARGVWSVIRGRGWFYSGSCDGLLLGGRTRAAG